MPKATVTLTEDLFLKIMNRELRVPGRVESVVQTTALYENGDPCWIALVDFDPVAEYEDAFSFLSFARAVYGPRYAIDVIDDPEDYAVMENLLAAASNFDLFSFDWVS